MPCLLGIWTGKMLALLSLRSFEIQPLPTLLQLLTWAFSLSTCPGDGDYKSPAISYINQSIYPRFIVMSTYRRLADRPVKLVESSARPHLDTYPFSKCLPAHEKEQQPSATTAASCSETNACT
jgi:hypothetical protein